MYPKEYINVQWWGVFSLFTTCLAFANHNRSSLDLFWFNLCRLGTLIDFSGLWVVLKSFKWCHLVFWNLPSLAEDEQVIEDIRITGFEKSAQTRDLLRWQTGNVLKIHIHASWKTLLCQTRRLQNTIINRSHRFGISYQINRQWGSGFRKQDCVTEVDRPWTFDGGVSRVFLYLFMIRVYISPQAQVFAVYSSPPTADVGGKTKRDGWTAFCDRPWPGYSILGLPQDLYPFIKPGPIDHL